MRKLLLALMLMCLLPQARAERPDTGAVAADSVRYAVLSRRADRSFDGGEWASAAALYQLMLDLRPDSAGVYARGIVAAEMAADTLSTLNLTGRAMANGVGLAQLLERVRTTTFDLGRGDNYGVLLHRLRRNFSWMARAVDNELLEYYTFRDDGPMIVRYASMMLRGLPNSRDYRMLLARGYMLSGDDEAAARQRRSVVNDDPRCYDALIALGNYLHQRGRDVEAGPLLTRAMELRPTPYVAAILDRIYPTHDKKKKRKN